MSDRFNGAAFFQSGKSKRVRRDIPDAPGASMEPLFFKAENRKWLELTHENVQWGFNGAAFFQSGKHLGCDSERGRGGRASMEPLFFKAENRAGRTCRHAPRSFNGAAFFSKQKITCWRRKPGGSRFRLQWSRFFSKRKIITMTSGSATFDPGFNGAAFFQSGK